MTYKRSGRDILLATAFGFVHASAFGVPVITDGLMHHWDFNSQSTQEYVSGNALGTTVGNSEHFVPHDNGYAFHATNQNYIRVPINSMFTPGSESFSLSLDFRMNDYISGNASPSYQGFSEQAPFVTYQGGDYAEGASLLANRLTNGGIGPTGAEKLTFSVQPTAPNANTHTRATAGFTSDLLGEWNNLTGVWDRGTNTSILYLNGQKVDETPFLSTSSIDPTWDFLIGAYEYSSARNNTPKVVSGDVLLDNISVYGRALSEIEAARLADGHPEPGPGSGCNSLIEFAGFCWRASSYEGGPQDAIFRKENVTVSEGKLALGIDLFGNDLTGAEIEIVSRSDGSRVSIGPGYRYVVEVENDFTLQDDDAVFGFFTYNNTDGIKSVSNEIDIELSTWGNSVQPIQYVVVEPPAGDGNNPHRNYPAFNPLNGAGVSNGSTHSFSWQRNRIDFDSFAGFGPYSGGSNASTSKIASWDYVETPSQSVPASLPGDTLLMNYWVCNRGSCDGSVNSSQQIIIRDFYILPETYIANAGFDEGVLSNSWLVTGAGTAGIAGGLANYFARMVAGSPVTLSQNIDTLDTPMNLAFDFLFGDGSGVLEIWLDNEFISSLFAGDYDLGAWQSVSIAITDSRFFGLLDIPLSFTYNGTSGTEFYLDNISLTGQRIGGVSSVPEPSTIVLFGLSALLIGAGLSPRGRPAT